MATVAQPVADSSQARQLKIWPRRGHLWLAALCYLAFVTYGSLVPLQFSPRPWDVACQAFVDRCRDVSWDDVSPSDWVANVLLMIPFACFALGAASADRPTWMAWSATPVVLTMSWSASVAIEFAQSFFPPRVASPVDVIAQMIGALVGLALWLMAGQQVFDWLRTLVAARGTRRWLALLLPGYVVAIVAIQLMPFDMTFSPVELYHKYKAGRVVLQPFGHGELAWSTVEGHLWNMAYFLPLGLMLSRTLSRRGSSGVRLLSAAWLSLALAAMIEFAQLLVFSRYSDVTDVLTGATAGMLGYEIGEYSLPRTSAVSTDEEWHAARSASIAKPPRYALRWALVLVWTAVLVGYYWRPFNFALDRQAAVRKLESFNAVPLTDLFWKTPFQAFEQFLERGLMFALLGWLLARAVSFNALAVGLLVAVAVACVALTLELGQCLLPSRYPSSSDVVIAAAAGLVGFIVHREFGPRAARTHMVGAA